MEYRSAKNSNEILAETDTKKIESAKSRKTEIQKALLALDKKMKLETKGATLTKKDVNEARSEGKFRFDADQVAASFEHSFENALSSVGILRKPRIKRTY